MIIEDYEDIARRLKEMKPEPPKPSTAVVTIDGEPVPEFKFDGNFLSTDENYGG